MQDLKCHQSVMLSIFSLLEECDHLSITLDIQHDLFNSLRQLDTYGQRLISIKAKDFLSIRLDSDKLEKYINLIPTDAARTETSSQLYKLSMRAIINTLEECPDLPEILKIDTDLLHRVKKLNTAGQHFICTFANEYLCIEIDNENLHSVIESINNKIADNELEEEYLRRLTPCLLMRELFGMHATEFSQRRRFLGLAKQGQHRPKSCDKETELILWQHWKKTETMCDRDRYIYIARKTGITINFIYSAVKSYRANNI